MLHQGMFTVQTQYSVDGTAMHVHKGYNCYRMHRSGGLHGILTQAGAVYRISASSLRIGKQKLSGCGTMQEHDMRGCRTWQFLQKQPIFFLLGTSCLCGWQCISLEVYARRCAWRVGWRSSVYARIVMTCSTHNAT